MSDLSTHFMGLSLPNPVVVSSSGLTANIKGVKKAVEAGAGAVVLKSLFEEDIVAGIDKHGPETKNVHPEAESYLRQMGMLLEPDEYLGFVEDSVKTVDVPVIASLNCYSEVWWTNYADRIEKLGAHAIELNLSPIALDDTQTSADIENHIVEMVRLARKTVSIPLAVKIGPNFTSLPHLTKRLSDAGANALTLFNRYYKVDIDIDKVQFRSGNSLSGPGEFSNVLRWIGILSDLTKMDLAASTGIYTSADLVKVLLAGGDVVQLCSVLYKEGIESIGGFLSGLSDWMESHGFVKISDFYSQLSLDNDHRDEFYQRLQYVKALKGKE